MRESFERNVLCENLGFRFGVLGSAWGGGAADDTTGRGDDFKIYFGFKNSMNLWIPQNSNIL